MSPQETRLDLATPSPAEDKQAALLRLFPEVRTEEGKIDFDRLQLALGEMIDTGKERFGLNWPGKADCFKSIQAPSSATLRPAREESIDFDTTENLIIEGDNLEVLKLLQKQYLGKVKMIYIDPPYNTGNDFVYQDNFTDSMQNYLELTGQANTAGKRLSTNADTDGRYHSKWLNMMSPRLFLARNLLSENGVIFISIDDSEANSLKLLCDTIFGEENRIETLVWKRRYGGGAKEKHIVSIHEYILMYAKNIENIDEIGISLSPEQVARYYKLQDDQFDKLGPYRLQPLEPADSMADRPNLRFPVIAPDGTGIWPKRQWLWSKERFETAREAKRLNFVKKENGWQVSRKQYLNEEDGTERLTKQNSIIDNIFGQLGSAEIESLFSESNVFSFPKPSALISMLVKLVDNPDGIFFDFFAGSGTTAHAVLDLNKQDGGNRKFILVQWPEPTGRKDYPTISDITKERVRRVIDKIKTESEGQLDLATGTQDLGFRVFKQDTSNFKPWDAEGAKGDAGKLAEQLELYVDNIHKNRTPDDLLFEILLKSGYPLTAPVATVALAGKTVHTVPGAAGELIVCLASGITLDLVKAIAARKPVRVVFLESCFPAADPDQLKSNAALILRDAGAEFRTV